MLLHDTCCLGIAKPGRIQSSYITATLGLGLGGGGAGRDHKTYITPLVVPKAGRNQKSRVPEQGGNKNGYITLAALGSLEWGRIIIATCHLPSRDS